VNTRKPIKVLAIDDSRTDLLLLRRALEGLSDYEVHFTGVHTLADAGTAMAGTRAFDLIFLDYRLGERDGVDVLKVLREQGVKLPIIMLTGEGCQRVAAQSIRAGANDYIIKDDLSTPTLPASIQHVLEAYQRQRKQSRALKLAMQDGLTGLITKEYLMQRLHDEFERSRRYHIPLSCVMIDLDHFKALNDTYGHLAGDEVLRSVAGCIRAGLRGADIGARFGGEEMCLLLLETPLTGGVALAERLREQISNLRMEHRDQILSVTASLGVAELHLEMQVPEDLLQEADTALYAAKHAGRNNVKYATSEGRTLSRTGTHC